LLCFWSHEPVAPWQTPEWIEQMRGSLRPNAFLRMIENRFVSGESAFVDPEWFDRCVDPSATPLLADQNLPIFIGVDASTKRDSTAIVAVSFSRDANKVRVVSHKIFQPTKAEPLNFEQTVERTVLDLCSRFSVRGVFYDPYQMAAVAQRLQGAGVAMREYPQTVGNLTAMGSNLYELIKAGNLVAYPDADIRLAMTRAVAVETPRGWKITKEKQSHKIDVVIALAMASLACIDRAQFEPVIPNGGFGVFFAPRRIIGDGGAAAENDAAYAAANRHGNGGDRGGVCW
jgi:phage terminase large subunit-like protein